MPNIRTFANLQTETLAWLDEAGDVDVSLTLVKQAIRAAHEKRLTDERWAFMLTRPKTLATVVGQRYYSLDNELLRLMYVKNLTTPRFLHEFVDQTLIHANVDWNTDTGTAADFILAGYAEVLNQPSSASVLAVSSTIGGDNGQSTITVTVRGYDSTGAVQTETIQSGASGVVQFTEILKVTKSSGWAGTMTITANAAAVTVLQLLAAEYGRTYRQFELLATPDSVENLEYRFYRQPSPLTADNDRPDYPAPFEELLVWEALCDLATYNNYDAGMVRYWTQKRDALDLSMRQTLGEAQTINQSAAYTDYITR